MQVTALDLDRVIQDAGMRGPEFVATTIRAALLFKGETVRSLAKRYNIHPVSLSQMMHSKRPWRKGLLPAILHDLDLYLMFT
jgi:hypothetical protein